MNCHSQKIILCTAALLSCWINLSSRPAGFSFTSIMEQRLSDEEKEMLRQIYEPVVVASPLEDARTGICILPDGEIRSYGKVGQTAGNPAGRNAYLSSVDCGLTWKLHYDRGKMHSCTYIPEFDRYYRAERGEVNDEKGTFIYISDIGPDDCSPRCLKISDKVAQDLFLPRKSAFSNRIWFTGQWCSDNGRYAPVYFYSDDGGEHFKAVELPSIKPFTIAYPHKGTRWDNCGAEPVVEELSADKMMMVIRNSLNDFYCSYSLDGGEHWSEAVPSPFHGTATTAYLLRLHDGRVLSFWNNSRPLPELDHTQYPPLRDDVLKGSGEDFFTNRDVNHVAVTDDGGETWTGARELFLNTIRNNPDFRYVGGPWSSFDKSVHQFQAFELPFNKILVSFGQNIAGRKIVIFDLDWLYETSRKEDFMLGLGNVSTQVYVRDICGHSVSKAGNGHCAWNRTSGALMTPDPDGSFRDVVQLSRHHDSRLLNDIQGLVWNFPASRSSEVEAEVRLAEGAQVRFSLADVWFNPCDPYVGEEAQFSTLLGARELPFGQYHTVRFSIEGDCAAVYVDGTFCRELTNTIPVPIGISYLHIQCIAEEDTPGVFIKELRETSK